MALLLNPTALRSDPVLNHNFVISLLDNARTWVQTELNN